MDATTLTTELFSVRQPESVVFHVDMWSIGRLEDCAERSLEEPPALLSSDRSRLRLKV